MPSVKRLHQIFLQESKVENASNAATTIFSAANADLLVIDPQFVIEKENFERSNINRSSVSPLVPLAGLTTGRVTFGLELSTATSTNYPSWGLCLEGAGMKRDTLLAVLLTSVAPASGMMAIGAGERIVQATTNAVGYLVHTLRDSDTHAFIRIARGSATQNNSGVWTSSDSGGSFTPATSAGTDVGDCWTPASYGLSQITVDGITADVPAGTIAVGATSGAVGVLVDPIDWTTGTENDHVLVMRRLDGTFTNSEVLNFSTGTTATIDSGVTPQQLENKALNIGIIEDGRFKSGRGMRGSWRFTGNIGEAGRLDFTFRGLLRSAGSGIGDRGPIPGVTYTSQVPPVMLGVGFTLGVDTEDTGSVYTPRLQSVNFDHGTEVNIPRDATLSDGVYDCASTTGRNSTGSFDIGVAPESTYAILAKLRDGTAFSTLATLTSPLDSDKVIRIEAPGSVMTAESPGEQNGFGTSSYTLGLGSRGVTGLDIEDAELIISYQNGTALPT